MRVLMVTTSFLPESVGGTEIYVDGLARALQREGEGVVVAVDSSRKSGGDPGALDVRRVGADDAGRLLSEIVPDVMHVHPLTGSDVLPWVQAARRHGVPVVCTYHTPTLTCARADLVRFGEVDCDGFIDPVRCAACVMQDRGMPVAMARMLSGYSATPPSWMPRKVRSLLSIRRQREEALASWRALRELVDAWVAPAGWVAEVLAINGAARERIRIVRQGTTHVMAPPRPSAGDGPLIVGFLGRLHPQKGLEVLLRAVRRIPHADIEVRIGGGGDPEEEARLRSRYADDRRIRWMGSVQPGDTQQYLAEVDVLVVPSLLRETGPLVALEAWSAGTPVIGTDSGGLGELLAEGGGATFPRGDAVALANLLLRMSRGELELPTIPRSVRTMEDVATQMRQLYSEMKACKTA